MGLSVYEMGVLSSGMSPGSAAMMLGRSQAWVERVRKALTEALADDPPVAPARETRNEPSRRPPPPKSVQARRAPRVKPRTVRLKPITDRVLRFAGWFRDAGWHPDEIAWLFDVGPEEMARALEVAL